MTDTEIIRWQTEPDGVVVLTMDDPAQSANTMSERFVTALGGTVARLKQEREHIAGVVLTSAKKTFFAGGDLHELLGLQAAAESARVPLTAAQSELIAGGSLTTVQRILASAPTRDARDGASLFGTIRRRVRSGQYAPRRRRPMPGSQFQVVASHRKERDGCRCSPRRGRGLPKR